MSLGAWARESYWRVERGEGIHLLDETAPHLAIVDFELTDGDGVQLIRHIKDNWVAVCILVISSHDDTQHSKGAMDAGAMGFASKHEAVEHILDAIEAVLSGQMYLNPQVADKAFD